MTHLKSQRTIFYERRFSRITIFKASRTMVLTRDCQGILLWTDVTGRCRKNESAIFYGTLFQLNQLQTAFALREGARTGNRSRMVDAFPGHPSNRSSRDNRPSHFSNGPHPTP